MNNFITLLPYHFKSAIKSIKRNFAMSLSSSIAVTITLLLVMIFLAVAGNVNAMSYHMEQSIVVYAQLESGIKGNDVDEIEEQIKAIPHVANIRYSDSEEELEEFIEWGGEDYEIFRGDDFMPGAFYIEADEGKNVASIAKACEGLEGMREVEYGGRNASNMIEALSALRTGGAVIAVVLSLLAIFLISNTIKITIQARRTEIGIMRNVGASNWFIKMPFIIEGMLIGLMGSIIPILSAIFGYGYLYDGVGGRLMSSDIFTLEPPIPFVLYMGGILLLVGCLVGMLGSFFSVNKYLKWKR